jgi:hypothetical protein
VITHLVGVQKKKKMEDKKWMSFEEAEFERQWYARREQELLRSWGLGWLIEFCSRPINKEEDEGK